MSIYSKSVGTSVGLRSCETATVDCQVLEIQPQS